MTIDYRGLRSLTAREMIAALTQDGFFLSAREDLTGATGILVVAG